MSEREVWAVIFPDGRIVADSSFQDEEHALRVVLGWPTRGEVKWFKERGGRAVLIKVGA